MLYKYDLPKGKMVADLFCGVGSLGLEAVSRGAAFVTFVEKDPKIIAILEKNIEKAGPVPERYRVIRANAFKVGAPVWTPDGDILGSCDEQKYALIFVDPPYSATRDIGEGSPLDVLMTVLSEQLVIDGIVVIRTHRRTELLGRYGLFKIIERRQWGTMAVTILSKK